MCCSWFVKTLNVFVKNSHRLEFIYFFLWNFYLKISFIFVAKLERRFNKIVLENGKETFVSIKLNQRRENKEHARRRCIKGSIFRYSVQVSFVAFSRSVFMERTIFEWKVSNSVYFLFQFQLNLNKQRDKKKKKRRIGSKSSSE